MSRTETIEDFYKAKFNHIPRGVKDELGHFNVFRIEDCVGPGKEPVRYSRRDFYKISLLKGKNIYHYAEKSLEVSGATLIFFNPTIPYQIETLSDEVTGSFCIFKAAFFTEYIRGSLKDLPMFSQGGFPAYHLDDKHFRHVNDIFEKMF